MHTSKHSHKLLLWFLTQGIIAAIQENTVFNDLSDVSNVKALL